MVNLDIEYCLVTDEETGEDWHRSRRHCEEALSPVVSSDGWDGVRCDGEHNW